MAKLTRVFAVAAFVLGLGLAAAQSTSAQTAANGGGGEETNRGDGLGINGAHDKEGKGGHTNNHKKDEQKRREGGQ